MTFSDLPLIPPLKRSVADAGYESPTPIQQATIPLVIEGSDVLGCAQTGTGKTAAFALPILQYMHTKPVRPRVIRSLILTPTRELALQIYESFELYGKPLPVKTTVVFGGVSQNPQVDALGKGVDILVATPGRLCDLISQGYISLAKVEIFVLDEADRMLDMGFIHDVKKVIAMLPAKRQTLFFSATMPPEVEKLAMSILTNPKTVKVDPPTSTVDAIRQCLYMIDKGNKRKLLAQLLRSPEVTSALVFSRTKYGVDRIVRELTKDGIASMAIHGDKTQAARQAALSAFKQGKLKVLIATDIAARGIDIAGLSHVINYDLPNEPESYIHRIGRTGRAGMDGDAISFCCIDEVKYLREIEKLIGRSIPRRECDWPMTVFTETPKAPRPGRTPEQIAEARRRGQRTAPKPAQPAQPARTNTQKRFGGDTNGKHTGLHTMARRPKV